MDRGRATCGGHKPRVPTTTLIRAYTLSINAYYATRRALHEGEDRDARRGPARRFGVRDWHQGAELRVPLDGRLQRPREGSPWSKVDTRAILTPI
jgi:hypothetical protein